MAVGALPKGTALSSANCCILIGVWDGKRRAAEDASAAARINDRVDYDRGTQLYQGCRAYLLQELRELPSPWGDRPHVAARIQDGSPLGEIDSRRGRPAPDATLVCRSAVWPLLQRPAPQRAGD
ncbi:hypothetical protein SBA4_4440014 [Candidatus Sulfopaludibacter sp. SbA4]|nr:hypothetical protein SBA4_4440014 [Candidatus Sulfopaludibacter sp. SbA4]